jgi:hypothetical protein
LTFRARMHMKRSIKETAMKRVSCRVDVIITSFGEKIGVFLINQCYDQIFEKVAVV